MKLESKQEEFDQRSLILEEKINTGCPMLPGPSRHKHVVTQEHVLKWYMSTKRKAIISRSPEAKAQCMVSGI